MDKKLQQTRSFCCATFMSLFENVQRELRSTEGLIIDHGTYQKIHESEQHNLIMFAGAGTVCFTVCWNSSVFSPPSSCVNIRGAHVPTGNKMNPRENREDSKVTQYLTILRSLLSVVDKQLEKINADRNLVLEHVKLKVEKANETCSNKSHSSARNTDEESCANEHKNVANFIVRIGNATKSDNIWEYGNVSESVYKLVERKNNRIPDVKGHWSKPELTMLQRGVAAAKQDQVIKLLNTKRSTLNKVNGKGKGRAFSSGNSKSESNKVRVKVDSLDWKKIAQTYVPGHSALECRLKYDDISPETNNDPFSKNEKERLEKIVKQSKDVCWESVAQQLTDQNAEALLHGFKNTRRTAWGCYREYAYIQIEKNIDNNFHTSSKIRLKNSKPKQWSKNEDKALKTAAKVFGRQWGEISEYVYTRTADQCNSRWDNQIGPNSISKKGMHWSLTEDLALIYAVEAYGDKSWQNICRHVPGRSAQQCRERFVNKLNAKRNLNLEEIASRRVTSHTKKQLCATKHKRRRKRTETKLKKKRTTCIPTPKDNNK